MKLNILSAKEFSKPAKLTVQKIGRLGFSEGAATLLKISTSKYLVIAEDEQSYIENKEEKNLYVWVEETDENGGYKVGLGGDYYYINCKSLLNKLNLDYQNDSYTIIFDIIPMVFEGNEIFKLNKRIIDKAKNKKTTTLSEE